MIEYRLVRSTRRTLGLEVTSDLEVVVRAPLRLPQREIDRFVQQHEGWIAQKLAVQQRRRENAVDWWVTPEQEQALRAQAKAYLPGRVAHYAAWMGVTPTGFKVTGAKKRLGSCSGKNSLCFSWRVMLYPPEAIDYVVVHELAHIRHHDHSRDFWACVAQVMPDYRERQALLCPDMGQD
ncbi:MAG: M48 family metallopeptidase [Ruminococcaceae bacterium]|nr:M48 family metallopeptidase [Oscillospiraceae bacterium]